MESMELKSAYNCAIHEEGDSVRRHIPVLTFLDNPTNTYQIYGSGSRCQPADSRADSLF